MYIARLVAKIMLDVVNLNIDKSKIYILHTLYALCISRSVNSHRCFPVAPILTDHIVLTTNPVFVIHAASANQSSGPMEVSYVMNRATNLNITQTSGIAVESHATTSIGV